jgi:hypothetical protein
VTAALVSGSSRTARDVRGAKLCQRTARTPRPRRHPTRVFPHLAFVAADLIFPELGKRLILGVGVVCSQGPIACRDEADVVSPSASLGVVLRRPGHDLALGAVDRDLRGRQWAVGRRMGPVCTWKVSGPRTCLTQSPSPSSDEMEAPGVVRSA